MSDTFDGTEPTEEQKNAYREENLKEIQQLSEMFVNLAANLSSAPSVAMNAFINGLLIIAVEHAKTYEAAETVMGRTADGMREALPRFWEDYQRQKAEAAAKDIPDSVDPAGVMAENGT